MEVFFRKFEISFFIFFFDREFVWIKVRRIFEYLERERERKKRKYKLLDQLAFVR